MIKEMPKNGNSRIKKGFALFPVKAGCYKVWFQLYEVIQIYNTLTLKWENKDFSYQTFMDWTKI